MAKSIASVCSVSHSRVGPRESVEYRRASLCILPAPASRAGDSGRSAPARPERKQGSPETWPEWHGVEIRQARQDIAPCLVQHTRPVMERAQQLFIYRTHLFSFEAGNLLRLRSAALAVCTAIRVEFGYSIGSPMLY